MLRNVRKYYQYCSAAGGTVSHQDIKTAVMYMYLVGGCCQDWHNRAGMQES